MNPEPLLKAIIDLAQAQLKLGALMTKALLGLQDGCKYSKSSGLNSSDR